MYSRRRFLGTVAAGLASGATAFSLRVLAQESVKQVGITVSFPAGGATDILARLIADGLRRSYAPTVVVENRPGAGGRIGTEYVKNGKNDGSVLLFTPAFPLLIFPQVYKNLPYDTLRDFMPVGIGARGGALALSIGPAVPASVKTVADFVQWCKENPKRAVFGAPSGSGQHFAGAMFARAAGIVLDLVPYKGGAPQIQDLLGGHIPASVNPVAEALPHAHGGKLRVLATTGSKRSPSLPDVPTMLELGYKDVLFQDWLGMFAPARTPSAIVTKLNAAMAEVMKSDQSAEGLAKLGMEAEIVTAERFAEMVRADYERYRAIVQATGFTADD
jgi:tripartite-type tricarboxylate transporter receptor subunit TctC